MKIIGGKISLIVIVAVLVGQTGATVQNFREVSSLVPHPEPKDELSKEQLIDQLNELKWRDRARTTAVSLLVANVLYRTRDKDFTEVIGNITVADLIVANNFHLLDDCSKQAFKKRNSLWESLPRVPFSGKVPFAVKVYLLRCLHLASYHCLDHWNQIVEAKINTDSWMRALSYYYFADGQGASIDEEVDENIVQEGSESFVADFIEKTCSY